MNAPLDWFDDAGNAAAAAFVASLIAIVVSIVAFRKSSVVQKRQLDIEEAREQDRVAASQRAELVAQIVKEPAPPHGMNGIPSYFLEIKNLGRAAARNIEVSLDGGPLFEHATMFSKQRGIRAVGPRSSFRYILVPHMQAQSPHEITMDWDDDSGEPGHYESALTS